MPCVFLAGLYRAERTIGERLTRLANCTLPWPWIDPDKALPWVEKRIGLALAESQVAAIRLALMAKLLVMTGGPGVGKTTIVKAILRIFAAKGIRLLLCAPTGRAAMCDICIPEKQRAVYHREVGHRPADWAVILLRRCCRHDVMKSPFFHTAVLILGDCLASLSRCFCRANLQSKQTTWRFIMLRGRNITLPHLRQAIDTVCPFP
jgi:hypothetical protein